MYDAIRPGSEWLDIDGKPIQAHGGNIFYENETFYWYGENKEKTDGKNDIWTWGIKCYSSRDFYNWKDEGFMIPAEPDDEESILHPRQKLDRPHILYNDRTGKYVCWLKISGDLACFVILTADHLLGPYTIIKEQFRPFNKKAGDFDLAKDDETGTAYLYFDSDHAGITSVELTEDYLDVCEEYTTHFSGLYPPFCREAPAHLLRARKHYLLTSGLTGYIPNPSETAISDHWQGPFVLQGNLHENDESSASFNSQISGVFKYPGTELYIALADRWVPEYVMTKERYDILSRSIASHFDERYQATTEEQMMLRDAPMLGNANTSVASYVWLPVEWDGERPVIRWKEEWRLSDYIESEK